MDTTVKELKTTIADLNTRLVSATTVAFKPPKNPDEIKAWATENPEGYDLLRSVARMEADDSRKELDAAIAQLKKDKAEAEREKAYAALLKAHPDFEELNNSKDFHEWAKDQPKWIQAALYEDDDPRSCIRAIDLYKADKGMTKADKKQAQSDAARNVRIKDSTEPALADGKKLWSVKEIVKNSRLDKTWFAKNEAEIDLAKREGRLQP